MRHYSLLDHCITNAHQSVRTLLGGGHVAGRVNPGNEHAETHLTKEEKKHVAGLMRVNHAGEVCAQALYHGQALTASLEDVREEMASAAEEEVDHLAWCEQRLSELESRPSYLNPIWYFGSLGIGMLAGIIGDRWSLGFVVETERQVVNHLEKHLQSLPQKDEKTTAILRQMKIDELHHAEMAENGGGAPLPLGIKKIMQLTSKIMTKSAYWI